MAQISVVAQICISRQTRPGPARPVSDRAHTGPSSLSSSVASEAVPHSRYVRPSHWRRGGQLSVRCAINVANRQQLTPLAVSQVAAPRGFDPPPRPVDRGQKLTTPRHPHPRPHLFTPRSTRPSSHQTECCAPSPLVLPGRRLPLP
jgi:hypothetical protein